MSRVRVPKRKAVEDAQQDTDQRTERHAAHAARRAAAQAEEEAVQVSDYLTQTVAAVLRNHVAPFLMPVCQEKVVQHVPAALHLPYGVQPGSAAAAAIPPRLEDLRAITQPVPRDIPLNQINRTLRQAVPADTPLRVRTKQFRDLLTWMTRWCEIRRDLLIDVKRPEQERPRGPDGNIDFAAPMTRTKIVGVDVLKEPAQFEALGLSALVFPTQITFLNDPVQVEARDIAWRAFLVGKTAPEYEAALARFRTTMAALQQDPQHRKLATRSGWTANILGNAACLPGENVSALEAVIQLVLGRTLVNADNYFLCMMWVLLEEFGAYAAWIVASFLVWMSKYSDLITYSNSMPSMFAHVARVMLDKDSRNIDDLRAAELELNRMRRPFNTAGDSFDEPYYGIWSVIRRVWVARGQNVDLLPESYLLIQKKSLFLLPPPPLASAREDVKRDVFLSQTGNPMLPPLISVVV
jgi:hypothetical protein